VTKDKREAVNYLNMSVLNKLIVIHILQKFPIFNETGKFIAERLWEDQKDEGTWDDRGRDGRTNFILRIKE
jgi:hypothetical protein